MYIIHYKNNEPIPETKTIKKEINGEIIEREEIMFKENIVDLEYIVHSEEDKNKWLDIIQKSYGNFGKVTVEEKIQEKPLTELERLQADNLALAEAFADLQYQNDMNKLGGTI